MIFEAVKPVRAGLAVIRISSARPPMSLSMSSHSSPVRWSHQMMEGRSTSLFSSSITSPCIWPEMPTPAMSEGFTPDFSMTVFVVFAEAFHQSAGSCSAQPF